MPAILEGVECDRKDEEIYSAHEDGLKADTWPNNAHRNRKQPRIERPPVSIYRRVPIMAEIRRRDVEIGEAVGTNSGVATEECGACANSKNKRLANTFEMGLQPLHRYRDNLVPLASIQNVTAWLTSSQEAGGRDPRCNPPRFFQPPPPPAAISRS